MYNFRWKLSYAELCCNMTTVPIDYYTFFPLNISRMKLERLNTALPIREDNRIPKGNDYINERR
jgi:hypothetical protein